MKLLIDANILLDAVSYTHLETEFPQWLLSEKSMPEEGVELLQHRP